MKSKIFLTIVLLCVLSISTNALAFEPIGLMTISEDKTEVVKVIEPEKKPEPLKEAVKLPALMIIIIQAKARVI